VKRCHACGTVIELEFVGRRDECPKCRKDLRACLNCDFYEEGRANNCREPQAETVKEKDRSNFCSFFRFKESEAAEPKSGRDEADRLWKDLFKRK
jgi:transposase